MFAVVPITISIWLFFLLSSSSRPTDLYILKENDQTSEIHDTEHWLCASFEKWINLPKQQNVLVKVPHFKVKILQTLRPKAYLILEIF